MRAGKIAGINFVLNNWLLVIVAIFAAAGMTGKLLGVFSAVLVHELAHAQAAKKLGYCVREIELLPFGGVAKIEGLSEAKASNEIMIAAAGPLTSMVMAAALYCVLSYAAAAADELRFWFEVNLMLALFNLLPGLPLDGGRILRAWLAGNCGYVRATRIVVRLSQQVSLLLLGLVVYNYLTVRTINLTFTFAGVFLYVAAKRELAIASFHNMRVLAHKKGELMAKGVLPTAHFTAVASAAVHDIIRLFGAECYAVILVVDDRFRVCGTLTETEVWEAIPARGLKAKIGDFL